MEEKQQLFNASIAGVIAFISIYLLLNGLFKRYNIPKKLCNQVLKIKKANTQIIITIIVSIFLAFFTPHILYFFMQESNILIISLVNSTLLGILISTIKHLKEK